MPDLIPPHGGLTDPVNRTVAEPNVKEFQRVAAGFPKIPVSDADLSSLYRIGDGGLSPLTGPMDRATVDRVLEQEVLLHNGKAYAWTIPIVFPVERALAGSLKASENAALVNGRGEVVGTLDVKDVFPFDKA